MRKLMAGNDGVPLVPRRSRDYLRRGVKLAHMSLDALSIFDGREDDLPVKGK